MQGEPGGTFIVVGCCGVYVHQAHLGSTTDCACLQKGLGSILGTFSLEDYSEKN